MTEPELKAHMNELCRLIESKSQKGDVFVLLLVDNPGLVQYASNGRREDVLKMLKEAVARFENNDTIPR